MERAFERLENLNGTMDQKAKKDAAALLKAATVSTTGASIPPVSPLKGP